MIEAGKALLDKGVEFLLSKAPPRLRNRILNMAIMGLLYGSDKLLRKIKKAMKAEGMEDSFFYKLNIFKLVLSPKLGLFTA